MFTTSKTYVSVVPGESDFMFSPDGITLVPRAQIVVLEHCPVSIRDTLAYAVSQGYVHAIANMRDTEYTMELLQK